jgi:beta-galactosidase
MKQTLMKHTKPYLLLVLMLALFTSQATARKIMTLENGWKFTKGDPSDAMSTDFQDAGWESVSVPHDWAIYGPFDKNIDKQVVAIEQNGEQVAKEKTGRTGALPYIGVGWYRTRFILPQDKNGQTVTLLFDGAMSRATVYVNGSKAGNWGYGYNSFYLDITQFIKPGMPVSLAVRLENLEESSRWYPGAGLYRNVHVIVTPQTYIGMWGTHLTTPIVSSELAKVRLQTQIVKPVEGLSLITEIKGPDGNVVDISTTSQLFGDEFEQLFIVSDPILWSPETPVLYTAVSKLKLGDEVIDTCTTRFGIRSISFSADKGFQLNGVTRKFKGVCLHHDLGPIGSAFNVAAMRRQLTIMKDMGCDAIRTSHNMPAPELLDLCDEMGFMVMDEAFDEWKRPKCKNGYNLFFDEWAEKDLVNFVRRDRNHPCIMMWSIGNEVPEQSYKDGSRVAYFLKEIIHREDPTRPVTGGMDRVDDAIANQFAATLDIPGLTYRLPKYQKVHDLLPQGFMLGTETASTVSSRGVYEFPAKIGKDIKHSDLHCSSYDLESCVWSNLPDEDWMWQDDKDWVIGEFVWTGFDYLGEPTPYDEMWPSRSSYFGICDLAGLPKDRYYLYRSHWNKSDPTLHVLPHWNWKGREGEVTPVFVYTSYPEAEIFINGKSQGRLKKGTAGLERYRLMWNNVKYEPGTLKVVAYDMQGKASAEKEIRTSGKPYRLVLNADRTAIIADGKDLSFVTVSVVDKDGNECPDATNKLNFKVKGAGVYRAACNGDQKSLEQFHLPTMKLFSGKLVVLVQSKETAGDVTLEVSGHGLKSAKMDLEAK